jgi:hypothetical protein
MLEHLQVHRQILCDLTANYLDPLGNAFERLAYLAGLREASSGRYVHEQLAATYGVEPVNQVVAKCHEEVFERLLEMPLSSQEAGLRTYVNALPGSYLENVEKCKRVASNWAPPQAPSYLTELYVSNLAALLELIGHSTPTAR